MGKNIKIIATVIPVNQAIAANNRINVIVRFTPRLPETGKLLDYYEIRHWYDYFGLFNKLSNISFNFYNKDFVQVGNPLPAVAVIAGGYRNNTTYKQLSVSTNHADDKSYLKVEPDTMDGLAKDLWHSMFPDSTPVSGWIINELPYELLKKLGIPELHKHFIEAIDESIDIILAAPVSRPDDPFNSASSETAIASEKESIIEQLHSLKSLSPDLILSAPLLRNSSEFVQYFLFKLYSRLSQFKKDRSKEIRDLSIEMGLRELEKRNVDESFEFHKKLSAYSGFPFLLKQTGWLWEYCIDITTLMGNPAEVMYIELNDFNDTSSRRTGISITAANEVILSRSTTTLGTEDCSPAVLTARQENAFFSNLDFKYPATAISVAAGRISVIAKNAGNFISVDHGVIIAGNGITMKGNVVEKNQLFEKINKFLEVNYQFYGQEGAGGLSTPPSTSSLAVDRQDQFTALTTEQKKLLEEAAGNDDGYLSSGISLTLTNSHSASQVAVNANKDLIIDYPDDNTIRDQIAGKAIIYLEHIHAGYRVDVMDIDADPVSVIRGLCRRDVFYSYHKWNRESKAYSRDCICIGDQDEGWVVDSLQASNSGNLYTDEELFRWNDWSLVASRIFNTVNDLEDNASNKKNGSRLNPEEILSLDSNLKIFSLPAVDIGRDANNNVTRAGTLPKLRFGNNYSFRLRFVDACGQSIDLNEVTAEALFAGETRYERTDPVHAPVVHLGEPLKLKNKVHGKSLREHWGEDTVTLVIRSVDRGNRLVYDGNATIRKIVPKKADFHFVKKHGAFDNSLFRAAGLPGDKDIDRVIELTTEERRGRFSKQEKEHLVQEKNGGNKLNHFYDPVITGFKFIVDKNTFLIKAYDYGSYWVNLKDKETECFKMKVTFDAGLPASDIVVTGDLHDVSRITIHLPRGRENELVLIPLVDKNAGNIFYNNSIIEEQAMLRIIHAVQKPVLLSSPDNVLNYKGTFTGTRKPMQSAIDLNIGFDQFPVQTSDTYNLHIFYKEIYPDLNITRSQITALTEDEIMYVDPSGFRYQLVHRVIKTGLTPNNHLSDEGVVFENIGHTLGDTRYRAVYYRLEALSRFRKYFSPDQYSDFSVYGGQEAERTFNVISEFTGFIAGERLLAESLRKYTTLPSTQQPSVPVIERVVPLLRWVTDEKGNTSRSSDTIRIYFEGNWFSSGEDEQVTVFYYDDGTYNSSNVADHDDRINFENVISQFGFDPTVSSVANECKAIRLTAGEITDPTGTSPLAALTRVPLDILDFENRENLLQERPNTLVNAKIFNIRFEPAEENVNSHEIIKPGQFYIDVKVLPDAVRDIYFPFVRLAIARYQQNSIGHVDRSGVTLHSKYQFSKVIVTDFVNLLPYREVNGQTATITKGPGRILATVGADTNIKTRKTFHVLSDDAATINYIMPHRSAADGNYETIEEYEDYSFPGMELKPDASTDEQEDYTKRLIFAYTQKKGK